jgi:DNA-binding response OmpR family regulator
MNFSLATVLVADPDASSRKRVVACLEEAGFMVREAADGKTVLSQLQRDLLHLLILDLQLPLLGGLALCERVKRTGDVPIVILTSLSDEATKIRALDLYADDYILKPPDYDELLARVKRILRRTWLCCLPTTSSVQIDDSLSIDFARRQVQTPEGVRHLTPLESRLLQLLVRNAGQILTADLILERLWDEGTGSLGGLWEYIRRVRQKIGDDASHPRYILNEPGLGYRFSAVSPVRSDELCLIDDSAAATL